MVDFEDDPPIETIDEDDDDEDEDGFVEDVDEEARENMQDFNFEDDQVIITGKDDDKPAKRKFHEKGSKLKIEKVSAKLKNDWPQYYVEGVLICVVLWFIATFFMGRAKNEDIAKRWIIENTEFLQKQFKKIGDVSNG